MNSNLFRLLAALLAAAFLCAAAVPARAQCDGICGTSCLPLPAQPVWDPSFPRDGVYITAHGVLNVMLVFVDFPDDETPQDQRWPVGAGPAFAGMLADPAPAPLSGRKYNLTTFFHDMSGGAFTVIGHPFYVQAPKPRTRYENSTKNDGTQETVDQSTNVPYYVNRDVLAILDTRLDSNDWKQYDTWTFTKGGANYVHQNVPDGTIDLIVMCYRNKYDPTDHGYRGEGFADLGGPGATMVVGQGTRRIVFNAGGASSGITCFNAIRYPVIDIYIHEMGHYLLGNAERYNEFNGGLWSLMGERHVNVSLMLNALERYQLGWGEIVDVDTLADGTVADIPDFGTTRKAWRYAPLQPFFEEFVFENHQGLPSSWITDAQGGAPTYDVVDHTGSPGLYIIETRKTNPCVVTADGRWNWIQDSLRVPDPAFAPHMQTTFRRAEVNRINGTTDRQPILSYHRGPIPGAGWYKSFITSWIDERTGELHTGSTDPALPGARFLGDGSDRWTVEENNIFSPWSNPSTHMSEAPRRATTFALEVLPPSGSDVRVKFFTTNPLDAPPSRPQNPLITLTDPDTAALRHPRLTWAPNIEPDVVSGGTFQIWRCDSVPSCNWTMIATVGGGLDSYIDTDITLAANEPQATRTIHYRLRALDTQGLVSTYSEERLLVLGAPILKPVLVSHTVAALHGVIAPNPVHDRATIRYTLPADGPVLLTLHDSRGSLVRVLVDEEGRAGAYTIDIGSDGLPSATYTWVLRQQGGVCSGLFVVLR